jgi:predicted XRE-type DNA-binding protein
MSRRASRRDAHDNAREERSAPTQAVAVKRALTLQIERAMNENHLTKAEMARRMGTSRSQVNRLLDPETESVTLDALSRAAEAVGRLVKVELVEGR